MGTGGYPTVKTRSAVVTAPHRGGAIKPPLPAVQEVGPRPYQDYPIGDWPHVRRRRNSEVPQISRRAKRNIRIAFQVGRRLNRIESVVNVIDYTIERFKQTGKGQTIYDPKGWTKCRNASLCTTEPNGYSSWPSYDCFGTNTNCLGLQAFTSQYALGSPIQPGHGQVMFRLFGATRATNVALFARGVGTVLNEPPEFLGTFVKLTQTTRVSVVQTLDAFLLPIQQPASVPEALTWRQIPDRQYNRSRDANEQYQRGYQLADDVRTRDQSQLDPTLRSWPDTMVVDVPAVGPPISRPPSVVAPHSAARPRRGTREKKLIGQAKGALKTFLNVVTEGKDVVDAVYKGLPVKRRKFGASPQEKAAAIYKHFDELDAGIAIKELIKNQAEDAVFGKIGRAQGKANRRLSERYGARIQIGMGPAL
jgi:hypothetical protein